MNRRHPTSSAADRPFDAAWAFEALPHAYLILNQRHEVVLANASYLKLTGQSLGALQGKSIYDINQFGTPEQREARRSWIGSVLTALRAGPSKWSPVFSYEMPESSLDENGQPIATGKAIARYWKIKADLLPPRDGQGGNIAVCVSEVTDSVSERERGQRERAKLRSQAQLRQVIANEAMARLRDREERFQIALAFSHLGAWELNPATGEIECTEQCCANLGVPVDSLLSESRLIDEIVHPEDRTRFRSAMKVALSNQAHFEVDFRVGWASGPTRWILLRGVGRHLHDGTLTTVLGFTLDITARKESELEQREIAASEKRARENSERLAMAMDHFVTTVSHELRSPLSAILSWTSLLERAADPAHIARASGVIGRNARQLSHMVDDLLDSGAIVTGKLSVNPRPVDLGALTGIVAEDMRAHAEAKGVQLIADNLTSAMVLADENRLKQVVWNLVSNAVKFTPQGTIELSVSALGDQAELTVRDTGVGLDAVSIGRIFERFEQLNASGSGRVAGLGLGLWLAKNLIDLHGGTITAESKGAGLGATFRVRLPVYR
jgi:signal transduction histidine kinase